MDKRKVARAVRGSAPARWLAHLTETITFGGELRERSLRSLLSLYYSSLFRRHWTWQAKGDPHFSLHAVTLFDLYKGGSRDSVSTLFRAFYSAELIQPGDVVLDIGCGDGSFTKRFLAAKARHVDGIELEERGVAYARRHNAAPNIRFVRMNAVTEPFPTEKYDIVVFDGAIGHFPPDSSAALITKISKSLSPDGVFCGSEDLGRDLPHDHLQFFDSLDDLRRLFAGTFKYVELKEREYGLRFSPVPRREAYWRCSNSRVRLDAARWQ